MHHLRKSCSHRLCQRSFLSRNVHPENWILTVDSRISGFDNCYQNVTQLLSECYPLCQDGEYRFIIFIPFPLFSKNFVNSGFTGLSTMLTQNNSQLIFRYSQFNKVFSGKCFVIHKLCEQRIMGKNLGCLRKTEDADPC